jgi:hypothetical protein
MTPAQPTDAAQRLSAFQRTMLLWERLHPYNAVHALRIPGPPRPRRLAAAIEAVERAAGIGALEIDPPGRACRYVSAAAPLVEARARDDVDEETPTGLLAAGLNASFVGPPQTPFRWTLLEEPGGQAHWVALAYRHVAADAHGAQALLAAVLQACRGDGEAPLLRIDAPGRARVSLRTRLQTLARFARTFRRLRSAHKMDEDRQGDDRTECTVRTAAPGLLPELRAANRRRGAGLNDACMAALAATIAERSPDRHTSRRRRKLALGTVVSRRPHDACGGEVWLGPALRDLVIVVDRPDAPLADVLAQISAQTRAARSLPDPGDFDPRLFLIQRAWPLLGLRHHRRTYRKVFPVCAGVTSFNVRAAWFGQAGVGVDRYVRASPPGPVVPVALAPTALGDRLELALVHRRATLTPTAAAEVLSGVHDRLALLAGG